MNTVIDWFKMNKKIVALGGICLLVLIVGISALLVTNRQTQSTANLAILASDSTANLRESSSTTNISADSGKEKSNAGYIELKGAVKNPGIYPIESDTRLFQIMTVAGGALPAADMKQVNLAQKLTDQMVVYVPVKGEVVGNSAVDAATIQDRQTGSTNDLSSGELINLNLATVSELTQLTGIGEKKAEQIIAYRETNGGFKAIEELKEVSGIGDKTYEALASQITV